MTNTALSPYVLRASPLAQRSIAAAGIGASYVVVGSAFSEGIVQLFIYSSLNETVQLSFDGINDFIPIPAGGTIAIDFKSNSIVLDGFKGVYVKEIGNPASGSLYVGAIGVS